MDTVSHAIGQALLIAGLKGTKVRSVRGLTATFPVIAF